MLSLSLVVIIPILFISKLLPWRHLAFELVAFNVDVSELTDTNLVNYFLFSQKNKNHSLLSFIKKLFFQCFIANHLTKLKANRQQ